MLFLLLRATRASYRLWCVEAKRCWSPQANARTDRWCARVIISTVSIQSVCISWRSTSSTLKSMGESAQPKKRAGLHSFLTSSPTHTRCHLRSFALIISQSAPRVRAHFWGVRTATRNRHWASKMFNNFVNQTPSAIGARDTGAKRTLRFYTAHVLFIHQIWRTLWVHSFLIRGSTFQVRVWMTFCPHNDMYGVQRPMALGLSHPSEYVAMCTKQTLKLQYCVKYLNQKSCYINFLWYNTR